MSNSACPIHCLVDFSKNEQEPWMVRLAASRNLRFPKEERENFVNKILYCMFSVPETFNRFGILEIIARQAPEFLLKPLIDRLIILLESKKGTLDERRRYRNIVWNAYYNDHIKSQFKDNLLSKYPEIEMWDDFDEIGDALERISDKDFPGVELEKLVGLSPKLDRKIARHKNCPLDSLHYLAKSMDKLTVKWALKKINARLVKNSKQRSE